jgi:hypothetical protein
VASTADDATADLSVILNHVAMDIEAHLQKLIDLALHDVGTSDVPTSSVLDQALRIARLRRDGRALVWLMMEAGPLEDDQAKQRAIDELEPYFANYEDLRATWSAELESWIRERRTEPQEGAELLNMSVREMEAHLIALAEMAEDTRPQPGLTSRETITLAEARSKLYVRRGQIGQMLARIRSRLHDYLSRTEQEIRIGSMVGSIFEEQRIYVEATLRRIAPAAVEQLAAAYQRRAAGDSEARSHALSSCRRALKTVADAVYPSSSVPILGADGRERLLTDQKFIGRLLQFAFEQAKGRRSRELLNAQIGDLSARLESLTDLASKGVHDEVSDFEVNQVVIQTYLTIGDILRLSDEPR